MGTSEPVLLNCAQVHELVTVIVGTTHLDGEIEFLHKVLCSKLA
jgi:hypothetical protein